MSRICVKNLPKYVEEGRLRDLFSQKGEITDAKLIRTKDGKSRQFGFIGFRTELEAEEAIQYFHRSYIDTFRITCEIACKVGDPDMARPWSRYSRNNDDNMKETVDKIGGVNNKKTVDKDDDPHLKEFLQVMQPRSKSKMWANDTLVAPQPQQFLQPHLNKERNNKQEPPPPVLTKTGTDSDDDQEKPSNIARDHAISDMDYFKNRVNKHWSDSHSDSENDNGDGDVDGAQSKDGNDDRDEDDDDSGEENADNGKHDKRETVPKEDEEGPPDKDSDDQSPDAVEPSTFPKDEKDDALESGRLFLRNLPYTATEEELEEHFNKFGEIAGVHLIVDKDTKRSKGIAYIQFVLPDSAARALEELDKSIFQGRLLHIMPAKQKNTSDKQETDVPPSQGSKSLKQRRGEQRKASEASGDTRAWNSLFMRSDTVIENIARRHGVSKSDILDREVDDLAVRIALGETRVIAETKEALKDAGINVASLEAFAAGKTDGAKRSNHALLVKNLPYASSEGELATMFGKFGSLDKIILPPTKTLALQVVFLEPSEARAAFRGLAYKRYKDVPLYLEWAPGNILDKNPTTKNDKEKDYTISEIDVKRVILEQNPEMDIDPDRVESRSLFVKNLNFKTDDQSLKNYFSKHVEHGKILSARIKKHLKNGKSVSAGFGFLEFDSVETATNVCRDLQGTVLDGHALTLQLCHIKKDEQAVKKAERDKVSTKLSVKNVAFEATLKDLRQLFSPFGQIKSLKLPKKFGNHRGFAFVEFVTKQEAQNALQALSNTHLYGRRLVLERAKEDESLEEKRARVAAQFSDEQSGYQNSIKLPNKRKQLAILDEGSMKFQRVAE